MTCQEFADMCLVIAKLPNKISSLSRGERASVITHCIKCESCVEKGHDIAAKNGYKSLGYLLGLDVLSQSGLSDLDADDQEFNEMICAAADDNPGAGLNDRQKKLMEEFPPTTSYHCNGISMYVIGYTDNDELSVTNINPNISVKGALGNATNIPAQLLRNMYKSGNYIKLNLGKTNDK
jgi:hypothetical protein